MTSTQDSRMWWLHQGDQTTGPHTEEHIKTGLEAGTIPVSAQVCLIDSEQWQPINEWPAFSGLGIEEQRFPYVDSLFTNSNLPRMANWICFYTILIYPVVVVIDCLTCCIFEGWLPYEDSKLFPFDLFMTFVEYLSYFVVTIALMVGGWRMRAEQESGATIVKMTLWLNYGFRLLFLFVYFAGAIVLSGENDYPETTTAILIVGLLQIAIMLGLFVFDIVSLIWLHQNTIVPSPNEG